MTLIHLITRLTLGGSARNTMDSAAAAARHGYRTILATGPSEDEVDIMHHFQGNGCSLKFIPSLRRSISPLRDFSALVQSSALIKREKPQIVHTHTSKAGFIGRLAAHLAGVPIVIHTPHGHVFYGYYGRTVTRFFITLERFAARLSDRIVVLTERGAEEHLSLRIGRPEQFVTIPSGVDIEDLRARIPSRTVARDRLGWHPTRPVVVGIGRLVSIKGFDLLVQALPDVLSRFRDARVVLVGDGPERLHLERLAGELGVGEALSIVGASSDVTPYLAAADVLVAPSRNEGMGRALVEAMSVGVPVVATWVGGIPSVVKDGESGILVPPDNSRAIADNVIRLIDHPGLRNQYSRAARTRAERFSLQTMETKLLALYSEVAREKGLSRERPEPKIVCSQL